MIKFLVRRVVFMILTLFLVSIAVFAITEFAPGNIALNTLGNHHPAAGGHPSTPRTAWTNRPPRATCAGCSAATGRPPALIGEPVTRFYDREQQPLQLVGVDADGTLFQNYTNDGNTMHAARCASPMAPP